MLKGGGLSQRRRQEFDEIVGEKATPPIPMLGHKPAVVFTAAADHAHNGALRQAEFVGGGRVVFVEHFCVV